MTTAKELLQTWRTSSLKRPLIMGIVNVTPDSFSDGGMYDTPAKAIAHGKHLIAEGADIIDIGGESTRPGANPITSYVEAHRILDVVEGLRHEGVPLSIDSRRTSVMERALDAGATMINDITALKDHESLELVAKRNVPIVLMHMQGTPETMQNAPYYKDAPGEVCAFLTARAEACIAAGISKDHIIVDPGIGFGKATEHSVEILRHLDQVVKLGYPVLIGVSRKSFIARLSRNEDPQDRLPGSLAATLWAVQKGASIVRVHDVKETRQALAVYSALKT
jgi:dihydropteroate synthase